MKGIKKNKRADLEDIILTIGLIFGILIIAYWFIFFVGNQTVRNQNLEFSALNKFSTYYELTMNSDEVNITGIEINAIDDSILTIENNTVCIKAKDVVDVCLKTISDSTGIQKKFNLSKTNFFSFEKQNGIINIKKN